MTMEATGGYGFIQFREVLSRLTDPEQLGSWGVDEDVKDTWLSSSAASYRMLRRLNSPIAVLFYEWFLNEVLPEAREIHRTGEKTKSVLDDFDECEQLRAEVRLLRSRLHEEAARSHWLESVFETMKKENWEMMVELSALRKGMQYNANRPKPTEAFLERVQTEFDRQAQGWRLDVWREEISIARAKHDEDLRQTALDSRVQSSRERHVKS